MRKEGDRVKQNIGKRVADESKDGMKVAWAFVKDNDRRNE